MGSANYSAVVQIESQYREGGHWVFRSPDIPGFFLAGKDKAQIEAIIPETIKTLYKLNYSITVSVKHVVSHEELIFDSSNRKVTDKLTICREAA